MNKQVDTQPAYLAGSPQLSTTKPASILDSLAPEQVPTYKLGVLVSHILAYIYILTFLEDQAGYYFPLALALIGCLEWGLWLQNRQQMTTVQQAENWTFLLATLAQTLALTLWGYQGEEFALLQLVMVHISFVFYVLSRTGWLSQGHLGVLVWYDGLTGFFLLPFKHFFLRWKTMLYHTPSPVSLEEKKQTQTNRIQLALTLTISIALALLLVGFVSSQLAQVSQAFSSTMAGVNNFLSKLGSLLTPTDLTIFFWRWILSLPVGAWLFGLLAGSVLDCSSRQGSYQGLQDALNQIRVFPPLAAYIIIGSLCLVYGLFFTVSLTEAGQLLTVPAISPQLASSTAVAGFWQLVRVCLLNFAVLAGFYLVGKEPLWKNKFCRLLTTLLFVFAGLFALIAAWKLMAIYIFLFGLTPLRLLSAWLITVLLVWCGLILLRLHRPILAIRYGLLYAFISFSLLPYLYALFL